METASPATAEMGRDGGVFWLLSSEMLAVLDSDARFRALNPAWEEVFVTPVSALLGAPFLDLFDERGRETMRRALRRARHGEPSALDSLPCRRRDGAAVWTSWRLEPGDEHRLYVAGREEAGAPVDRLERTETALFAELGATSAVVAHDINNILTLIHGSAFMLGSSPGLTPEQRRDSEDIISGVRHGAELVRQVFDLCRREASHAGEFDLNAVIQRMDWVLRHVGCKDIAVEFRLAPVLGMVKCSEAAVGQALLNLVVNARDAMPTGGRIAIETKDIVLAGSPDLRRAIPAGAYVALSVADNGPGIPSEARERLFEPFFTTKPTGTGLGLYGVKRTAERFGGAVAVETSSAGTRFTLYLPRLNPAS